MVYYIITLEKGWFFISYVIIILYIVGQYLQRGYLNEPRIDDSKKLGRKNLRGMKLQKVFVVFNIIPSSKNS